MKKKIAGILALTLAFATLLGGCGSKMTADDAKSYAQRSSSGCKLQG